MTRKRAARGRSGGADPDESDVIVLGGELAAATRAERRRKASRPPARSPMPAQKYDFDDDDLSLLKPVSHPLDGRLVTLSRRFAKSSDQKRIAMRAAIGMDQFYTLLEFARRAAVFAIREKRAAWAVDGLTAVAMIEAERVDWRDILVAVGLLHHAATRIGRNADQLLQKTSRLAEPGTAALMDDIRQRPRHEKTLDGWGYEEVETDAGIGLVEGGFGGTKPAHDLTTIATEIADHLKTDRYRPSSIEVGDSIPSVWLESRNSAAVDKALRACRTGVSIDAELRRTRGVKTGSQHFVVFLQEMKSEASARRLLAIAQRKRPRDFCKVELAEGRLFCLIIARSFWTGVRAYETPESLARFAEPIGDILRRHARR